MTIVPLARRFLPLVLSGQKNSTIRKGVRRWAVGPAVIASEGVRVKARITDIRVKTLADLTDEDAVRDGFQSLPQLRQALLEFYPSLSPSDKVTIASFRIV
jgi:hypothetical protein